MKAVTPKKRLGQHFLTDVSIAEQIVQSLTPPGQLDQVIEIGPGTGVLSNFLMERSYGKLVLMDIDKESIGYLRKAHPEHEEIVVEADFLKVDLHDYFHDQPYAVIGNFPYNISSQIFFKILDERARVTEVVCMIQKEVADRISSSHGSKVYGILSVLLQAYFDIDYLFTVGPEVFDPPPKVQSAVIRLVRNETAQLACDETLFKRVVKEGFQKRRKTLRNALKGLNLPDTTRNHEFFGKRAEQLSVQDFVELTNLISG